MLPEAVRARLTELLQGHARAALASSHAAMSGGYRKGRNSSENIRSDMDALAYAAARMPATHAAVRHALLALAESAPGLAPSSMLDVGCGPGTATLAAVELFPTLAELHLIDRNRPMLDLATDLVRNTAPACIATFAASDLAQPLAGREADLVISAYVLVELPSPAAERLAMSLWQGARQALLLAEPGTPEGFARLRRIRELLLGKGAHVAAPCTHHAPCPMAADRWCRVPVRVQRSRDHRALKGGTLGYEDEPLAYLALTREPPDARPFGRVTGPPRVSKAGVSLPLCNADGLLDVVVPSRDRENHKRFSRLDWGDAVANPLPGLERMNPP
jgi:ribosomal protein RSM22 (predicted rRNA methylase)